MNKEPLQLKGSEVPAVIVENEKGSQPVVLICEHAGKQFPSVLGSLGLNPLDVDSHIAWDIGAAAVARLLAQLLDAPLIMQRYSRLVYDCNRPRDAAGAIPIISASIPIAGNLNLNQAEREARFEQIYLPFHTAITDTIDACMKCYQQVAVISIHSFTPVFEGKHRSFDLGVLHDSDTYLADEILTLAQADPEFITRRNEPYGPEDGVTHTINVHGIERGLPNVMLEIRNDLIFDIHGQRLWAQRLASLLTGAIHNSSGSQKLALNNS